MVQAPIDATGWTIATRWISQYRLYCQKYKSVYFLDCSSILAERSDPPPAGERGPLEAPPVTKQIRVFASFPITIET